MSDPLEVTVGGVRFLGHQGRDQFGYWVEKDGWSGWETSPAARSQAIDRVMAHGAFDLPQFLGEREVTMKGFYRAPSYAQLEEMGRVLSALLADGTRTTMTVKFGGGTQRGVCRRALGEPLVRSESDGDLHVGRFELAFRFPDPRKYGPDNRFTGTSMTVSHRGSFPAHAVVSVAGPHSGFTLTGPGGKQFVVTQAAGSGQTHEVNMRTGRVSLNGIVQSGAVSRADTWVIPPGLPGVQMGCSRAATVLVPDTYV